MGEKYSLSRKEIKNAQAMIIEQLHNWQIRKSITSLVLFLIWLYEFLEVISVNNTGKTANRKSAISVYSDTEIIAKLFSLRSTLVHKFWTIEQSSISGFYNQYENELITLVTMVCYSDVSVYVDPRFRDLPDKMNL